MVGFGILAGKSVDMVLPADHARLLVKAFWMICCNFLAYPGKSGAALLDGSLKLKCCIVFVSQKRPTRGLVQRGRVAGLLSVGGGRWVVLQLSLSSGCPTIGGSLEAGGFWKRAWPFRAANPR